MKKGIYLSLFVSLLALAISAHATQTDWWSPNINSAVIWSDTTNLHCNVIIGTNGILTLNYPGVVIVKGNFSITVDGGNLLTAGTTDLNKVLLTADEAVPLWGGIVVKSFDSASMHTLQHLKIVKATTGIYVWPNIGTTVLVTINHCRIQNGVTGIAAQKLADPPSCVRITNCTIANNSGNGVVMFNLPAKPPLGNALWVCYCEIANNGKSGMQLDRCPASLKVFQNWIHDNVQTSTPYADYGITCVVSSPLMYNNRVEESLGSALGCAMSSAPSLTNGLTNGGNTFKTTAGSSGNNVPVMRWRNAQAILYKAHCNILHAGGGAHLLIYDESSPPSYRKVAFNYWEPYPPNASYFYPSWAFIYTPYDNNMNNFPFVSPGTSSLEDSAAYDLLEEGLAAEAADDFSLAYDKFMEVVQTYPDVEDAICQALPHILSSGAQIDVPYEEMYAFFDEIVQGAESELMGKVARQVRNDCHVAMQIFDDPIEDYQEIVSAPETLMDSVSAVIDLNQIGLIMESLGMPGPESMNAYNPRTLENYLQREAELMALLNGGSPTPTKPVQPASFELQQNYPNPFNPTTTLQFNLPEIAKVDLVIYDCGGRAVAHPVSGWRNAGLHEVTFDGSGLASGIYVYRLTAGQYEAAKKMVLMK